MARIGSAPIYDIEARDVVAVEHPMVVKNLQKGLKTFGNGPAFSRILESESVEACIPLYLRHNDPMCAPILSRNACTDNILLKITVPKRTGRKRKRGSQDPFSGPSIEENGHSGQNTELDGIRSQSRRDDAAELQRTLKDTIGRYNLEAVGTIDQTHRFRGLADFHQSVSNEEFVPKVRDAVSSCTVDALRGLNLDSRQTLGEHVEIPPPWSFSIHTLPANWNWRQNIRAKVDMESITGEAMSISKEHLLRFQVDYVSADSDTIPDGWFAAIPNDPELLQFISELKLVFDERPIWARRALINRVAGIPNSWLVKPALKYIGYQFKGGPYRECVIKYGLDPREDSKYSIYQSLVFQTIGHEGWDAYQKLEISMKKPRKVNCTTHIFDGKTIVDDGKIWQLCDITDPDLAPLIHNAPLRDIYDKHDGHLYNGVWAKIRSIMKVKLLGLLYNIDMTAHHLEAAKNFPDKVDSDRPGNTLIVPFPNFNKMEQEIMERCHKRSRDLPDEEPSNDKGRPKKKRKSRFDNSKVTPPVPTNTIGQFANGGAKEKLHPPTLGIFQNSVQAPTKGKAVIGTSGSLMAGSSREENPRRGSISQIFNRRGDDMDEYEMGLNLEFGEENIGSGSTANSEDDGGESEATDVVDFRKQPYSEAD